MCVCTCVCMYMCVFVCLCMCVCFCVCVLHLCMFVHVCVCMCFCVCMYLWAFMCVFVCVYKCVCVCLFVKPQQMPGIMLLCLNKSLLKENDYATKRNCVIPLSIASKTRDTQTTRGCSPTTSSQEKKIRCMPDTAHHPGPNLDKQAWAWTDRHRQVAAGASIYLNTKPEPVVAHGYVYVSLSQTHTSQQAPTRARAEDVVLGI